MASPSPAHTYTYPPLPPSLTRALTNTLRLPNPTKTQHKILQPLLNQQSTLIKARTGTGKTIGYAIATVANALKKQKTAAAAAAAEGQERENTVILLPTKELGVQVGHTIR